MDLEAAYFDEMAGQPFTNSNAQPIAAYAAEMAGTEFDLHPDLEWTVEHLMRGGEEPR